MPQHAHGGPQQRQVFLLLHHEKALADLKQGDLGIKVPGLEMQMCEKHEQPGGA